MCRKNRSLTPRTRTLHAKSLTAFSRRPIKPQPLNGRLHFEREVTVCDLVLRDIQFEDKTSVEQLQLRVKGLILDAKSAKIVSRRVKGTSNNHHCFQVEFKDVDLSFNELLGGD